MVGTTLYLNDTLRQVKITTKRGKLSERIGEIANRYFKILATADEINVTEEERLILKFVLENLGNELTSDDFLIHFIKNQKKGSVNSRNSLVGKLSKASLIERYKLFERIMGTLVLQPKK